MFAVIFEVQPKQERWNDYLDLAKYLKAEAGGDRRFYRQRALREQADERPRATMKYSKASTVLESYCFSLHGGMPKRPQGGRQSQLRTWASCATDGSASFAISA
jgi:hypothetical protein